MNARNLLAFVLVPLLTACASLPQRDPLEVTVAGIDSLPGEGLEMRMVVKLRVQNPNDAPLDYNGAALKLSVQNRTLASGVSDASGSVPRFGEVVVAVPVTISALGVLRQVLGFMNGTPVDTLHYRVDGKLNGPLFGGFRFHSDGDFKVPADLGNRARAAEF